MPETIKYNGRSFKFFTQDEVDGSNKSPDTFIEVPPEVVTSHGLTGPLFYYVGGNPMGATAPWSLDDVIPKAHKFTPDFLRVYTDGMGPLNGPEVRYQEELHGVPISDHTAVRAYNEKLSTDAEAWGGMLSLDDVVAMSHRNQGALLMRSVEWWEDVAGATPVFFKTQTSKVISEDVTFTDEFGIPHYAITGVGKVDTVGIAFPGPHCKKRDVFNLTEFLGGKKNPLAAGKKAMDLPGRDRWFRVVGTEALSAFAFAPVLIWSGVQVSQILEGRPVTMDRSPRIPDWLWERQ